MKFCILILPILLVNSEFDTCEQQKICRLDCDGMEYSSLERMTPKIQDMILKRVNGFRNDVALGKKYSSYLPAAANMQMMQWNREFEYYSEGNVRGDTTCIPYEILTHGWQSGYYNYDSVYNLENSLNLALQNIFDMTFSSPDRILMKMNIIANNTQIGCAFGTYIDRLNKVSLVLRCTTRSGGGTMGQELYEVGEPCSKCNLWNETCSIEFKGLCNSSSS